MKSIGNRETKECSGFEASVILNWNHLAQCSPGVQSAIHSVTNTSWNSLPCDSGREELPQVLNTAPLLDLSFRRHIVEYGMLRLLQEYKAMIP